MLYIIQTSIYWLVFLLLFELILKKNTNHRYSRFYLMIGMISGILLPLLLPFVSQPEIKFETFRNSTIAIPNSISALENTNTNLTVSTIPSSNISIWFVIYLGVALLLLTRLLWNLWKISTIYQQGIKTTILTTKVVFSQKPIAPFSFAGWIFISQHHHYSEEEMILLIKHEQVHNQQLHWIDNILSECFCIIFWFNPLIWRFAYHLRLTHEFEADSIASFENKYAYGKLLILPQVQHNSISITPSFYFSPLKQRIDMLTKNKKSSKWAFAVSLPILFFSTILLAQNGMEKKRVGNISTFMGNTFEWNNSVVDTYSILISHFNSDEKTLRKVSDTLNYIDKINNEKVKYVQLYSHQTGRLIAYENEMKKICDYLSKNIKIKEEDKKNISVISLQDVVIDKNGKLKYFDIRFDGIRFTDRVEDFVKKSDLDNYSKQITKLALAYDGVQLEEKDLKQNIYVNMFGMVGFNASYGTIKPVE